MRAWSAGVLLLVGLTLAGCASTYAARARESPSLLGSRDPSEPLPLVLSEVSVRVSIFEGEVPVLDAYLQVPQSASVERVVPDRYGVSHDISIALGDFDKDRREQILTLDYTTDGGALREVLRCQVGQTEQRFVGGRRLELRVVAVPDPADTSWNESDEETAGGDKESKESDDSEGEESPKDPDLWVIPDAPS